VRSLIFILPYCIIFAFNSFAQQYKVENEWFAHAGGVQNIHFSPNGKLLASGGKNDFKVKVWQVETGKLWKIFSGPKNTIYEVNFNSDGKLLACASKDGTVWVWEINSGKLIGQYKNQAVFGVGKKAFKAVAFACFTLDNNYVVFGGENGFVSKAKLGRSSGGAFYSPKRIFQANTHTPSQIKTITSGALTPNGKSIMITIDNFVQVIDLQTEQRTKIFYYPFDYLNDVVTVPNKNQIATWSYDGKISIWDFNSESITKTINASESNNYSSPSFSSDSRFMVSGAFGSIARVWKGDDNFVNLAGHKSIVRVARFSPTEHLIATASYDGSIKLWKQKELETAFDIPVVFNPLPPSPKKKEILYFMGEKIALGKIIELKKVQFEQSSHALTEEAEKELEEVANFLMKNESIRIEIHGHTDDAGHPIQNYKLSESRANASKKYLSELGIDPKIIKIKAFGESKPAFDNLRIDTKRLNRRIEIKIVSL
jgi:WD40 repeat protein